MAKISVQINGKEIIADAGKTILDVAKENAINIPTLCYLKDVCEEGNCRLCMVENTKNGRLLPACKTKIYDGLAVLTHSEKVEKSRRTTLELLLSHHNKDCINCSKNHKCKFQELLNEYDITKSPFGEMKDLFALDTSSPCITKDQNKCILCSRCVKVCKFTQSVVALSKAKRGAKTVITAGAGENLENSACVGCGQCTLVCPTGALDYASEIGRVQALLRDKKNYVTCQVAPSVRVSLAEEFGADVGTFDEGRLVRALKKLGFKKVFDINLGADFTVKEEAEELIERLTTGGELPLFTSCCPAWFKFAQTFYPEYVKNISSCKSPTEMLGAIIKNYYAQTQSLDKENVKVVGIMPCTAKKGEKQRAKDVDASLTTRELAQMIKDADIDYFGLKPQGFDTPLSSYSGGALIFGVSGGVCEAALRYASGVLNKKSPEVDFVAVRGEKGIKEATVTLGDIKLSLCVASGLKNARTVVENIKSGRKKYDFVEIMACPGGCINGGGQALVDYGKLSTSDVRAKRAKSLYQKDGEMSVRVSQDNVDMQKIYKDFFLDDKSKAHDLLHHKIKA